MGFFDYITKIDFSILYYIQEHLRCSFLDFLMPLFGFIQEGGMVWIVISIILICFKKTRYCGFAILLAMGIDTLITEFTLKNIICRVRPCNIDFSIKMLVSRPDSYGFPSNHSASAFAAATALLVTLKKRDGLFWDISLQQLLPYLDYMFLYISHQMYLLVLL